MIGFVLKFYSPVTLVVTALVILGLRRRSLLNRMIVLTAMMLAFPAAAADYKLINLYVPLGLLILTIVERGCAYRPEVVICLTIALILIPKTYFLPHHRLYVGFGFIVNACALIALIVIGLMTQLGERPGGPTGVAGDLENAPA